MTKAEQETIIRWAADEPVVHVFTAHPATMRKIARSYTPVKVSRQAGREVGWFFTVPLTEFRWRVVARRRHGRLLSEAERQAAGARLAQGRGARNSIANSNAGRP
jgi:hypothetical protein